MSLESLLDALDVLDVIMGVMKPHLETTVNTAKQKIRAFLGWKIPQFNKQMQYDGTLRLVSRRFGSPDFSHINWELCLYPLKIGKNIYLYFSLVRAEEFYLEEEIAVEFRIFASDITGKLQNFCQSLVGKNGNAYSSGIPKNNFNKWVDKDGNLLIACEVQFYFTNI